MITLEQEEIFLRYARSLQDNLNAIRAAKRLRVGVVGVRWRDHRRARRYGDAIPCEREFQGPSGAPLKTMPAFIFFRLREMDVAQVQNG